MRTCAPFFCTSHQEKALLLHNVCARDATPIPQQDFLSDARACVHLFRTSNTLKRVSSFAKFFSTKSLQNISVETVFVAVSHQGLSNCTTIQVRARMIKFSFSPRTTKTCPTSEAPEEEPEAYNSHSNSHICMYLSHRLACAMIITQCRVSILSSFALLPDAHLKPYPLPHKVA